MCSAFLMAAVQTIGKSNENDPEEEIIEPVLITNKLCRCLPPPRPESNNKTLDI